MIARGRAIAAGLLTGSVLAGCAVPQVFEPPAPGARTAPPYPAPEPAPTPIAPPPVAETVVSKLDEAAVRAEYGAPDFVRKEADSELWRYDGAGCALFLFLYRENDAYLLRYRETLPRGANDPADAACEMSIKARAAPAS